MSGIEWPRSKVACSRPPALDDPYLTKIFQHLLVAGASASVRCWPFSPPNLALRQSRKSAAGRSRGGSVELIHVGSLYHDDVIDESDIRRGAPSANANWTNTVAILAGDFLMARASEVAATYLSQESVRLLAVTYAELVVGQSRELQLVDSLNHSTSEYERVIGGKTASLIRTSARLGAMAADAEPDVVETLTDWAWELGMVFQLSDDALDLVGNETILGKPAGSDIREGNFTLPVLAAIAAPDGERLRQLLDRPRPYDEEVVTKAIEHLRNGGWIDQAIDAALSRTHRAQRLLKSLPDVPARQILVDLGSYLVNRVGEAREQI